jgi:hypothetical protein
LGTIDIIVSVIMSSQQKTIDKPPPIKLSVTSSVKNLRLNAKFCSTKPSKNTVKTSTGKQIESEILKEYVHLSLLPKLSKLEENILLSIYQKAEQDKQLHFFLMMIDDWIFEHCEPLTEGDEQALKNQDVLLRAG